jgi:TonB-linked SusC/RagA family outer membrane protein
MYHSNSLKRALCKIEPQKLASRFTINLDTFKKLAIFLLSITFLQASANGQGPSITLSKKNVSFVQVLSEIRKQSGYGMVYNSDLMQKANTVSIDVKAVSLEEALKTAVVGQPFSYTVKNNTVVITPKQETEKAAPIDVKGKVLDENRLPLIGASVRVKGGTQGAMTDANGAFTLKAVDSEATLVVSYIGYQPKEVKAGANLTINLTLDNSTLTEVAVIGYGTQKRSEVTGSISSVKGADVAGQQVSSFDAALGGRAAGVNIIAGTGNLNQAPVFRIRGTNSLSLSSYPLIVIDGIPSFTTDDDSGSGNTENNPLSSINPNDIESIDIAKDAAATSIYGSRAANGVVFITTKKGKLGKAKINFSTNLSINNAINLPKLLNAAQYIETKNEGLVNEGTYNATTNYYGYSLDANGNQIDTRWYDHVYQTGISTANNLNISGATEATKYYASVGYTNQNGIFQKTNFNKKQVLFNVDNKTTNWLSLGLKINYNNELNAAAMASGSRGGSSSSGGMSRVAIISAPIVGPYNRDGSFNNNTAGFLGIMDNNGHLSSQSRLGFYNPASSMDANYSNSIVNNIQSNAFAKITPFPWLTAQTVYGIDYRYGTNENYSSPYSGEAFSTGGSASSTHNTRERVVITNTLQFDKTFGKQHNFSLLLGEEEQTTKGNRFGLSRTTQTDPLYNNIQGGWQNVAISGTANSVNDNYLFSLFSRMQYNFKQKYYASANYRQDEYSALGLNNKKGTFWGVSGGWDIFKEEFWANSGISKVLNNLKLRASYGKVGNIGGLSDFGALNTYSASLYGGQSGLSYSATGNADLQWETSKKTDIGINFGLFGNKVFGEIAYYRNNIDGLIFGVPLPPSVGLPNGSNNSILKNVGKMYNTGLEFTLSGSPIRKDNFEWSSSFNLTTNKNEVLELADGVPSIIIGANDGFTITLPGYSAGMIYAVRTAGVEASSGRRIFINNEGRKVLYQHVIGAGKGPSQFQWSYEDNTRAPAITPAADAVIYKQSAPKVFGGLSNAFNYKGFELNVLVTYQLGGYMMNGTQATMRDNRFWNNSVDMLRRWQTPGQETDIAKIVNGDNVSNGNTIPLDINVSSTDFLRLKSASLSYNVPSKFLTKFKLSNTKIFMSAQNLLTLTKYTGLDPEVTSNANSAISQGIDKNQSPNARAIVFGLNFGF